jgi:hypothetical protein
MLFWLAGLSLCQSSRGTNAGCGLVEQALKAYQEVKPGITRKEVERNFEYDGGLDFRELGRYTFRGCNYIKVEVNFVLAPDIGNVPDRSNDTVATVSKLFIDYPSKD